MKSISMHGKCECGKTLDVEIQVSEESSDGLEEGDVLQLLGFDYNGLGELMCAECIRSHFLSNLHRLKQIKE